MKHLTEEVLKLHTKELNFFNDRTYYIVAENEPINLNILDDVKSFVVFSPSLLTDEEMEYLFQKIFKDKMIQILKSKMIYVLSLFTSVDIVDRILEAATKNNLNLKISTLFYSNELMRYSQFLRHGVRNLREEYFNNDNFVLSYENYCDFFRNMARRYFN